MGGDPAGRADAARAHGLTEADRLLRQGPPTHLGLCTLYSFQDVKKRLKLSQQFVEAAQQARQEAEAAPAPQMPDQLNGKVLTATLKNGKAICPEFQTNECPNPADSCPFGVPLVCHPTKIRTGMWWQARRQASATSSGRCWPATAVPAAPKPSATLVPAAVGEKATFGRKRTAASGAADDEMAEVMRTAVKKARGQAAPKTPPKAPAIAAPKTPPKAAAGYTQATGHSCAVQGYSHNAEALGRSGEATDQGHAKERPWQSSRRHLGPPLGAVGCGLRDSPSTDLHLDIPEGWWHLPGRASNEADGGQVPQDSVADLLLPEWS